MPKKSKKELKRQTSQSLVPKVHDYYETMAFKRITPKPKYNRLVREFISFHNANPEIWKLIVHFAYLAIKNGHKKLGISLVVERVRWETTIVTNSSDGFKLSNNHRAYYARMFNFLYDRLTGREFFTTRPVESEVLVKLTRRPK